MERTPTPDRRTPAEPLTEDDRALTASGGPTPEQIESYYEWREASRKAAWLRLRSGS
jgi:hypothetical protein